MKKLIALLLSLMMLMTSLAAVADTVDLGDDGAVPGIVGADTETQEATGRLISSEEFGEFVVGATTRLNGDFFTDMWGNNTCDIDVRSMLHGLETVYWDVQYQFQQNPTVVVDLQNAVAENGEKTYTLTLAQDLVYNDGTPITAKDYILGLMLYASPLIKEIGGLTTNVAHIKGYEAYSAGELPYFEGLRLVDDYTFTLTILPAFLPYFYEMNFINATPYPISVIAPGCVVVDNGNGCEIVNEDAEVAEPILTAELLRETILNPETGYLSHPAVTSGPYTLESFDWETRIAKFRINENFKGDWHGHKATIDNVVFRPVTPNEMMTELEEGSVHLLNKVVAGADITEGLNLGDDVKRLGYPRLGFGFVSFACEDGATQFASVRQAIAYATNVPAFVRGYNQSYGLPVYGYYGVGQWMVQAIGQAAQIVIEGNEEETAAWNGLTLSNLNTHSFNLAAAKQLLIDDGWTLNEAGDAFVEGTDAVRCKMIDDQLVTLRLKFGKMQDSTAVEQLLEMVTEPLAQIGIELEVTEVPFAELLEHYYRQRERTYDMMYLATNFLSAFDPYFTFNTRDAYQGHQNTTGYRDAALEVLALELRRTEPEALLEYAQKWVAFQEYFSEKVPMLPLYSNIYYDFFAQELQGYRPDGEEMKNWPTALLHAYLAEPAEVASEFEPAYTEEEEQVEEDETVDIAE